MVINKDTLIFGSFAKEAGNNGCMMFNKAFDYYGLNAIYKSFSIDNIEKAIQAARTLNFKGFAITMPYKKEVIKYIDELSEEVKEIGSVNTIVNNNGILRAYNTDYLSSKEILSRLTDKDLFILGEGGLSLAVQYSAKLLGMKFKIINRKNWGDINNIKNSIIFNCTPVSNIIVDKSNRYIDCLINTNDGKKLSIIQASYQYKIYTGIEISSDLLYSFIK